MVPFERVSTVSYSHSIATMAVSLAVLTQNTNVADTGQKDRQTHTHTHTHSYRMAARPARLQPHYATVARQKRSTILE